MDTFKQYIYIYIYIYIYKCIKTKIHIFKSIICLFFKMFLQWSQSYVAQGLDCGRRISVGKVFSGSARLREGTKWTQEIDDKNGITLRIDAGESTVQRLSLREMSYRSF